MRGHSPHQYQHLLAFVMAYSDGESLGRDHPVRGRFQVGGTSVFFKTSNYRHLNPMLYDRIREEERKLSIFHKLRQQQRVFRS